MAKTKRGYSYEFTPRSERDVHISLRRVPPELHRTFKAKCKREGVSMRYVILSWVRTWIGGADPLLAATAEPAGQELPAVD